LDFSDSTKQGFRLQHHPSPSAERSIVHGLVAVGGEVSEIVNSDIDQSTLLCLKYHAMGEWAVKELREDGDDVEIHEFLRPESTAVRLLEVFQSFRQVTNEHSVWNVNSGEIALSKRNQEISCLSANFQKIVSGTTQHFEDFTSDGTILIFNPATHQIMLVVRTGLQPHQLRVVYGDLVSDQALCRSDRINSLKLENDTVIVKSVIFQVQFERGVAFFL